MLGHVGVPRAVEQGVQLGALDGLARQQHGGHLVHLVAAGLQHLAGACVGLAHHALDLVVDALGGLGGVVLVVGQVAAQEDLVLRLAKDLRAQRVAHAVARDHAAGQLGGALDVVGGAGGDVVAEELLG